ncbi:MAG: sugar transferase [Bdellovibrionaceae bacterium]|nr:sugar transferase [Pseudobdellovibrionaceae bacterium]
MGKRAFDFTIALIGLLFLSPLFVLISFWVKIDSSGPVFFRQDRVGLGLVPFRIHKFRTMVVNAEDKGMQITVGADSRITRSGSFLRRYKLDELPQLIDVVVGTMSLVGPRPEVPHYVSRYPPSDREKIFKVRPGITDWASIRFKDENDILGSACDPERTYVEEILPIKIRYAKEYVDSSSCLTDLHIILSTLREIARNSTT